MAYARAEVPATFGSIIQPGEHERGLSTPFGCRPPVLRGIPSLVVPFA